MIGEHLQAPIGSDADRSRIRNFLRTHIGKCAAVVVATLAIVIGVLAIGVIAFAGVFFLGMEATKLEEEGPFDSPSGKYEIMATVDNDNPNPTRIHCVQLELRDASGAELDKMTTGASCFHSWSVNWMPKEDVIVLESGDIGTTRYTVKDGKLTEIE